MAGRPRQPVGTFGAITTTEFQPGRFRATTRFRDWDGKSRKVTATATSRNAATTALKLQLAKRIRASTADDELNADSSFADLAAAWLDDLRLRGHPPASNNETPGGA